MSDRNKDLSPAQAVRQNRRDEQGRYAAGTAGADESASQYGPGVVRTAWRPGPEAALRRLLDTAREETDPAANSKALSSARATVRRLMHHLDDDSFAYHWDQLTAAADAAAACDCEPTEIPEHLGAAVDRAAFEDCVRESDNDDDWRAAVADHWLGEYVSASKAMVDANRRAHLRTLGPLVESVTGGID